MLVLQAATRLRLRQWNAACAGEENTAAPMGPPSAAVVTRLSAATLFYVWLQTTQAR